MLLTFLKLFAWLPLPAVHAIAHPLGWLLYGLKSKQRYYADTNLALCFPELSKAERRRFSRASLIGTVKVLLEYPLLFLGRGNRVLNLVREVKHESTGEEIHILNLQPTPPRSTPQSQPLNSGMQRPCRLRVTPRLPSRLTNAA